MSEIGLAEFYGLGHALITHHRLEASRKVDSQSTQGRGPSRANNDFEFQRETIQVSPRANPKFSSVSPPSLKKSRVSQKKMIRSSEILRMYHHETHPCRFTAERQNHIPINSTRHRTRHF